MTKNKKSIIELIHETPEELKNVPQTGTELFSKYYNENILIPYIECIKNNLRGKRINEKERGTIQNMVPSKYGKTYSIESLKLAVEKINPYIEEVQNKPNLFDLHHQLFRYYVKQDHLKDDLYVFMMNYSETGIFLPEKYYTLSDVKYLHKMKEKHKDNNNMENFKTQYSEINYLKWLFYAGYKLTNNYNSDFMDKDVFGVSKKWLLEDVKDGKTIHHREYNPGTNLGRHWRGYLPDFLLKDTHQWDIKSAHPSIMAELNNIVVNKPSSEQIELLGLNKRDILSLFNKNHTNFTEKFLTAHQLTLDEVLLNLQETLDRVYGNGTGKYMLPEENFYNKGRFAQVSTEKEKEVIEKFCEQNGIEERNSIRIHDAIVFKNSNRKDPNKEIVSKITNNIQFDFKPLREVKREDCMDLRWHDNYYRKSNLPSKEIVQKWVKKNGYTLINFNDELIITTNENKNVIKFDNNIERTILTKMKDEIVAYGDERVKIFDLVSMQLSSRGLMKNFLNDVTPEILELNMNTRDLITFPFKDGVIQLSNGKIIKNSYGDKMFYYQKTMETSIESLDFTKEFDILHYIKSNPFIHFICEAFIPDDINFDNFEQIYSNEENKHIIDSILIMLGAIVSKVRDIPVIQGIILTDQGSKPGIRDGRRGKSLIALQACKDFGNITFVSPSKSYIDPEDPRAFASIERSDLVMTFDDIPPSFDFQPFATITQNGLTKKNMKKDISQFSKEETPTPIFTGNYITDIEEGGTNDVRLFEYQIYRKLNSKVEYQDRYNDDLDKWTEEQTVSYYEFLIHCARLYQENNCKMNQVTYNKSRDKFRKTFYTQDGDDSLKTDFIEILLRANKFIKIQRTENGYVPETLRLLKVDLGQVGKKWKYENQHDYLAWNQRTVNGAFKTWCEFHNIEYNFINKSYQFTEEGYRRFLKSISAIDDIYGKPDENETNDDL